MTTLRYVVSTQSNANQMKLHSTMKDEFVTTDLSAALDAFNAEVEELNKCYTCQDDLTCTPTDEELNHAIYCSIKSIDEDGEIDFVKDSEYFYE